MASDAILEITDANFDQTVLKSDQPVMVDGNQVIPRGTDVLVRQHSAISNGQINTVGALGVFTTNIAGFDIAADGTAFANLTVFVNGVAVKKNNEPTRALPGQVLRKE